LQKKQKHQHKSKANSNIPPITINYRNFVMCKF
jgi:hypothetical protein